MPLSNVMLSIIYMLLSPRHYIPIIQCNCYFAHTTFPFNLSTKLSHFRPFLRNFLTPNCYSQTTCYQHTLLLLCLTTFPTNIKLFFPGRFSLSAPLTTQIKSLLQSHKLSFISLQI